MNFYFCSFIDAILIVITIIIIITQKTTFITITSTYII